MEGGRPEETERGRNGAGWGTGESSRGSQGYQGDQNQGGAGQTGGKECRFGSGCKKGDCRFSHPTSPSAVRREQGTMGMCFSKPCFRDNCWFAHTAGQQRPSQRVGTQSVGMCFSKPCYKGDCRFAHITGQHNPGQGRGSAVVMQPITGRFLCAGSRTSGRAADGEGKGNWNTVQLTGKGSSGVLVQGEDPREQFF